MTVALIIVRYPRWAFWAGLAAMAVFRLPLRLDRRTSFYKLMGCGTKGSFKMAPDFRQWAIMVVQESEDQSTTRAILGKFISNWLTLFKTRQWTLLLSPIEGHGLWDGKKVFGDLQRSSPHEGLTAVLTRATIRMSKATSFQRHIALAADPLKNSEGFIYGIGIGESPMLKQATFSIWQNKQSMKEYAYKMREHREVIDKTRKENWYREELFVRFKILASFGDLPEHALLHPYL